jgi:hypothetical protein
VRGARTIILSLAVAVLVAACGSSSSSGPLNSALSYFPKNSPFVMSVVTDPNAAAVKNGQKLIARIPYANFGQAALISRLQQVGINYDTDIRPLFGNPLLVGLDTSTSTGARNKVLVAWVTKDAGTLNGLVKKLHVQSSGSHAGATLYQAGTAAFAVQGATLLIATTQASLTAALDRHSGSHGMTASSYNSMLGSLPKDALVNAGGSLNGVLNTAKTAKARRVPWVAALNGYGLAITAGSSALNFQYTLDTSGGSLTSSRLPIAEGSSPPGLAGNLPIQVGLREPATTVAFLLDAMRRTQPAKFAQEQAQMQRVEKRTGVNFQQDVLRQMGNNAAIESTGHMTIARVDVVNPPAASRTLHKLGTSGLDLLGSQPGSHVTAGPGSFYTVHQRNGKTVLYGLVGSEFVAGNGSPAQLRAFAAAPATAAPGAQGAAAFRIALPQLLQLTLRSAPSKTAQQVLSVLGDLTGWFSSSPSALNGQATLAIK